MTYDDRDDPGKEKLHFIFSLRAMFVAVTVIALLIVAVQFAWPRRTVQEAILVPDVDAAIYSPHIDAIAKGSNAITDLQIDARTNTIVVTAQARYSALAAAEVSSLIRDPSPAIAASVLGVTLDEAREILAAD